MIDRAELSQRYRSAAIKCGLIAAVPVALLGLAFVLGPGQSTGPGALTPDPVALAILAVSCLLPVGVVPLFRRSARGKLATPATPRDATATQAVAIAALATVECYFWVSASVWGFLAVMEGGPMLLAFLGVAVSLIGVAYSFPRWSVVAARADELENPRGAQPAVPR